MPAEHALQGFDARSRVRRRARTRAAECSRTTLGFAPAGATRGRRAEPSARRALRIRRAAGGTRGRRRGYRPHVAWSSSLDGTRRGARVAAPGMHPSPIIDRFWFHSIYFREPTASCSRSRRWGLGSRWTRTSEHLGEALNPPALVRAPAGPGRAEPHAAPDPRPWATAGWPPGPAPWRSRHGFSALPWASASPFHDGRCTMRVKSKVGPHATARTIAAMPEQDALARPASSTPGHTSSTALSTTSSSRSRACRQRARCRSRRRGCSAPQQQDEREQ